MQQPTLSFYENPLTPDDGWDEVIAGLRAEQKTIPPKYFYDETGSRLFTAITRLPEYYPTRTELALLRDNADEISELIGRDSLLVEFGSGSSEKIQILLEHLRPREYIPLDISRDYLELSAKEVDKQYPWLKVRAACLDYTTDFELPFELEGRAVGFFPGSSIGNFTPEEAEQFLARVRRLVSDDGGLLIGVDMKKDEAVLNAAYNDADGVTRDFNLNALSHLNQAFEGNFELANFAHRAFYNADESCIQMFLDARVDHTVELGGETIAFHEGEAIHTENSFKYSNDEFLAMAGRAGFSSHRRWQDEAGWFSVYLLT